MSVISTEARLMAGALRHGRKMQGINRVDAARALRISLGELGLFEGGRMPIPRGLLNSLIYHGVAARMARAKGHKK